MQETIRHLMDLLPLLPSIRWPSWLCYLRRCRFSDVVALVVIVSWRGNKKRRILLITCLWGVFVHYFSFFRSIYLYGAIAFTGVRDARRKRQSDRDAQVVHTCTRNRRLLRTRKRKREKEREREREREKRDVYYTMREDVWNRREYIFFFENDSSFNVCCLLGSCLLILVMGVKTQGDGARSPKRRLPSSFGEWRRWKLWKRCY
jgi:hypothetical protein